MRGRENILIHKVRALQIGVWARHRYPHEESDIVACEQNPNPGKGDEQIPAVTGQQLEAKLISVPQAPVRDPVLEHQGG